MKILIALVVLGNLGTYFLLREKGREPNRTRPSTKTISYEQVNEPALRKISAILAAQKNNVGHPVAVSETKIDGKAAFSEKVAELFNYLKTNQVLYRYELNNSMNNYLEKADKVQPSQVTTFNNNVNEILDFHGKTINRLRFDQKVKDGAWAIIETMKNPIKVTTTVKEVSPKTENTEGYNGIREALADIKITREVTMHSPEVEATKTPVGAMIALWTGICSLMFMAFRKKNPVEASENNSESEEQINPTFKRIMSDLDYPMVMVDQGFNIIWQNKNAEAQDFNTESIQNIFKTDAEENEFKYNGAFYVVTVSELNYKSGKKKYLAQLKPKVTSNKHLEHLIDSNEITSMIESKSFDSGFGDVNQSVAQLSVKLGYLFKVSGKFLDVNFNKGLSDCFIENERLEGMLKEFIMGCHHMVKDDSEVQGIYMRTDESGNKFSVSCFLMNFRKNGLESHPLTRDFLRRFSILEARHSMCNPVIEFRFKETGEVKGLDITLNFENRSEMETMLSNLSANA